MSTDKPVTVLAQTENTQFSENGIQYDRQQVVGIDCNLGLAVIARGDAEGVTGPAYQSVEILLDDMALNLVEEAGTRQSSANAAKCLRESLDNINEFLTTKTNFGEISEQQSSADLAAIQFQNNALSCCNLGVLSCYIYRDNTFQNVFHTEQGQLGIDEALQPVITEQAVSSGDVILLTSADVIQKIGQEFIRLTLSRFTDNLEMVMRQINTRTARNGMKHRPVIILYRIDQVSQASRSWFSRLTGN